jgi:hypothetical protein
MSVAVDHVPEEYVKALPRVSTAAQNELETQETAEKPSLSALSTFTGADHSEFAAGAEVEPPTPGLNSDPGTEIAGVGVAPHAAASNPAAAAATSESRVRRRDAGGFDDLSFAFMCFRVGVPEATE